MKAGYKKIIAALLIGFISTNCFAQKNGNGIGNEEVIVVKEYEATIQDAQKINIQPDIPEVEETKPKLDYSIPQKDFKDVSFEPNPARPLSISKEKLEHYNSSFIKVGFGSQIMPLIQLAYNDNKTQNLKFGFSYDHLSAQPFKVKNQSFSNDLAGAYVKFFPEKLEIGADFTFHNYLTHFYGTDSLYSEKQVRQQLRNYYASVYLKNAQKNKANIDFGQTLNFDYFQETFGHAHEWYMAGTTNFQKTIAEYHTITASFNFDVSELKSKGDSPTLQRNLFTPMVGYAFNNDDWRAHAKFGLTIDGSKVFFVTNLHIEKRLYEHALIAYLSYLRYDQKNSLSSYAYNNNFIQNSVSIKNSVTGDFGVGLKGTVQNFSYNVAFHLNQINNLPLFVNDSMDMKHFNVVYDSNTLIYNFHFEAGYNVREWLRFLVIGDYNGYQLKNNLYAWHDPNFTLTFRTKYIWKNKISATADIYGVTSSYALLPENTVKKLSGTIDANLAVEYLFNKHLSFFISLNNIANIKYPPWYHYQTYGINGMIGGKFSF